MSTDISEEYFNAIMENMEKSYPDGYTCDDCGEIITMDTIAQSYDNTNSDFINLAPCSLTSGVICHSCLQGGIPMSIEVEQVRRVLSKCLTIYEHLDEIGSYDKWEAYKALGLSEDIHNCPCCGYVENVLNCVSGYGGVEGIPECVEVCPINWGDPEGCLGGNSPYTEWSSYGGSIQPIIDLIKKTIIELN